MSTRVFILLLVLLAIDLYVFSGMKVLIQNKALHVQRFWTLAYWTIVALCIGTIVTGQFIDWHSWPKGFRTYSFAVIVIIYLSKVFVVTFLLIDDIVRLFRLIFSWTASSFSDEPPASDAFRISRLNFLVKAGFIFGSIPFFSMIYGMLNGAYNFRVRKVALKLQKLPASFEGFKIVQISDLHLGSYMGISQLAEAVELINSQRADVVFFTGDLVNDLHTEAIAFTDTLRGLTAPMGVFSVLGNHDYGDYYRWTSMHEKEENLIRLKQIQKEFGWKLLLNEHTYLERNGEKIGIIGVENYSARRGFSKYGDMNKATDGYNVQPVNILLSHDPSHWDAEIRSDYKFIDLTVSGHTHGFQFGIEIPGFRWSPVQYVYKQWADLYKADDQHLYVNRGLGFIGYPGRVGILPEITVFELTRS